MIRGTGRGGAPRRPGHRLREMTSHRKRAKWAEVYRATYRDVVQYLYRKLGDRERAQELAQEAFARALEHDPENPRAWLFTVAGNLARVEARDTMRRRRHLTLLKGELEAMSVVEDGAAAVERQARREAVRRALEQLGDRDREILLLWSVGLSYAEIAARTGLAVGAIGTTLARARRKLAAAYESVEERNVARG